MVLCSRPSPTLCKILLENQFQEPVIYFQEVQNEGLKVVLDYMYLGYAIVEQEMLQSFIRLAREMELDGIVLPRENISEKEFTKIVTESKNVELESEI